MRRRTPGMLARTRNWWELRILFEPPGGGGEGGPKRFVVLETDGRPEGYAIYRHKPKWDEGLADSELQVVEAVALDGRPTAELWRYLLDIDWAARITAIAPAGRPPALVAARDAAGACGRASATGSGCGSSTSARRCPRASTRRTAPSSST